LTTGKYKTIIFQEYERRNPSMKKITKYVIVEKTKQQKIVKKGYDGDQITTTSNANEGQENTSGQGQQQTDGKKGK
jgi:hypothetical protein